MTYVLDASALLRFTDKEPGYERVRTLLHSAAKGEVTLLLSAVNWGEIVNALYRRHGQAGSKTIKSNLLALPITIISVDAERAEAAAFFKAEYNVPYADAFAGSLALHENATLITGDYDFKNVPKNTIRIEFLPTK